MSSPRTAARLTRLLAMLPWVIGHPGATVDEVCARFGYEPADLLRDLNLVFVCGLPGYGPGELMDAYVDEDEVIVDMADYFARPVRLTAAEALMMLSAGLAVQSSGAEVPALDSAVAKLQAAVVPDDASLAVELAAEPELVPTLRSAAAKRRVVDLTYTAIGSGKTTERAIEPWQVFSTMGNWYVTGHCRLAGEQRIFRVDRVRNAEVTDEEFPQPEQAPPAEVRYTPGVDDVTARIQLSKAAGWVAEYYPVEVIGTPSEGVLIEFSSSDPAVAARLLLRLGDAAHLEAGDEVRAAADDLRARVLARYR